jgi:dihydroorotase-like cyclic amidohydrolase
MPNRKEVSNMAIDLLFKGGKVVTAGSTYKADVAVKDGKIVEIGTNLKGGAPR